MKRFVNFLLRVGSARWIVNEDGDFGIEIFGVAVIRYKNSMVLSTYKSDSIYDHCPWWTYDYRSVQKGEE